MDGDQILEGDPIRYSKPLRGKSDWQRRAYHIDANTVPADSVCADVDVVNVANGVRGEEFLGRYVRWLQLTEDGSRRMVPQANSIEIIILFHAEAA
jgi:hypothetical protein